MDAVALPMVASTQRAASQHKLVLENAVEFCHFPALIYVEFIVEQYTHMETIQVVIDEKLLKAADIAAKRQKVKRSALIRRALLEHLRRLREVELEKQDLRGYTAQPQLGDEYAAWERLAEWPKD